MKLTKKFFCPVNDCDCPYWKKDGSCSMVDKGDDPMEECEDAYFFFGEDEHLNPYVWEDEDGNLYDVQELLEKGYPFIDGEPVDTEMWEKRRGANRANATEWMCATIPTFVNTPIEKQIC